MLAGKTTLLRYVLENSKEKIACIVNDVASINIDAKLVRNDKNRAGAANTTADLTDTIELQNGCACRATAIPILPALGRASAWHACRVTPS